MSVMLTPSVEWVLPETCGVDDAGPIDAESRCLVNL